MKTFKNCGLALAMAAALVMTMTTMASCSSENELTETPSAGQPAQPTAKGVKVTVTAGISDGATTRSAVTTDGTTRTLKFTEGDRLYVYGDIEDAADDPEEPSVYTTLAGYLDIDATSITDGTSATFTGTLYTYQNDGNGKEIVYYDFGGADPLDRCNYNSPYAYLIHSNMKSGVYEINDDKEFSCNTEKLFADDVETLMTTCLIVSGEYSSGSFALGSNTPIFNCTFSSLTAEHDYTATMVFNGNISYTYNFTTDAGGVGTIVIAPDFGGEWSRTITIKDGDDEVGTIDLGTRDMTAKVYNVKRNYGRAAFGKFVDISTLSADFEAQDGDVLSGTLANNVKISIAAGAMVTLSGARINDNEAGTDRRWTDGNYAGLTCLGDATIILADGTTNTVRNFDTSYPGIRAAHNTGSDGEYTLTIRGGSLGTGQLIASSDGGAGIGGGNYGSCGNITIEGGTVTANGGGEGAGIGSSSYGSCGDITINGGTVTATGDPNCTNGGAGIGSGYMGSCGKITIEGGSVTATGGTNGAGIGSSGSNQGYESICGKIEITGGIVSATGGTNGAGIGSGMSNGPKPSTCGDIMITLNSGSITATGGQYAAGIGTGYRGICGSIMIPLNRGSITATGGTSGAGIGTGYQGICGSISVYEGIVDAYRNNHNGGYDYYDIGRGVDGTAGSVNVYSQVKTSNGKQYIGSNAGYRLY